MYLPLELLNNTKNVSINKTLSILTLAHDFYPRSYSFEGTSDEQLWPWSCSVLEIMQWKEMHQLSYRTWGEMLLERTLPGTTLPKRILEPEQNRQATVIAVLLHLPDPYCFGLLGLLGAWGQNKTHKGRKGIEHRTIERNTRSWEHPQEATKIWDSALTTRAVNI